nr:hypothetical protein [Aquicoccus sp. G2-2]MEA1113105.1 hypothetical protein [Aquicoccus sp. G2-2]
MAISALAPLPASAGFSDCTDSSYLGRFPDAPSAGGILCVEQFRFSYATPEGSRSIRAISDVSAGWAVPPAMVASAERGARAAAVAMAQLGSYAIDDITILLLDDTHSFTESPEILAITDGRRDPAGARTGECLVTLYGLTSHSSDLEIAVTTAHEIFHCLQYASLTAAQMGSYGRGGTWWIEGSAEYFSALAVSGSQSKTDRGAAFDDAVGAGIPLNEMGHQSSPFFFWLGETRGANTLIPFLHAMAGADGAASQRSAMRAALPDAQWLQFAQSYVDGRIAHPQGGNLALSPSPSETRRVSAPGTQRVTLAPFAILFATVDYDCGTWGNSVTPSNANIGLRRESERNWGAWPEEIEVEEGAPGTYWLAGMNTGDSNQTVSDQVERRRACVPCGPTARLDVCLNGTWQVTGGGPIEWMRANGIPLRNARKGPSIITFRSDGVYGTEPVTGALELRDDDSVARGEGYATAAFGRWSAKDGELHICQDAGGVRGTVTLTTRDTRVTRPVTRAGAGQLDMRYSCTAGQLVTNLPIRGLPPMQTTYGKLAEEVPRP